MLVISRLSCLALLLALSVLPAFATAQTPTTQTVAATSKDTVLFDFEGGSYEG